MPTVLRLGPYRFHFYSREPGKPPHIPVAREDLEAKFWLQPVALARNLGYSAAELRQIRQLVTRHRHDLTIAYRRFHGR